jgi:hypothetical protein
MHIKRCKDRTPLHLQVAYLSGFKKGGVCNLICRSLFHCYGDLFYLPPFTPSLSTPHLSLYLLLLLTRLCLLPLLFFLYLTYILSYK